MGCGTTVPTTAGGRSTLPCPSPRIRSRSPRNRRRAFVSRAEHLRRRRATTPRRGGKHSRTVRAPTPPPPNRDTAEFRQFERVRLGQQQLRTFPHTMPHPLRRVPHPSQLALSVHPPPSPSLLHLLPSPRLEKRYGELTKLFPDV
ncbi:uncharacterized protein SCHCODRAFT_02243203 [Schizophyllum commune H4-8]|uniref:uncharacterized protein n=1 Tax=Schizophyllum commune (strain H4-8 / FGSC 9210) TaxID=578458 RepID=UPI00215DDDF5|nr:uncharacterized protein SCHCODRAFT_02243203 [Schizophyllum commune H4-8]KAI5892985.1 hypothetical protein SCHCODRAFT_02243203 [Schizophyllum commune H4-8]